jgi:hypothetical protein
MPAKSARLLTSPDAAYLAGLVDGEGTIALSHRHANERRQLVLSISSTERCILDWVRTSVDVGKITRKRVSSVLHAPGLTYSVSNRQALSLIAQIAPFLRSYKKRRAELVLDRYLRLTPRNGRYTTALADERRAFENEFANLTARS